MNVSIDLTSIDKFPIIIVHDEESNGRKLSPSPRITVRMFVREQRGEAVLLCSLFGRFRDDFERRRMEKTVGV